MEFVGLYRQHLRPMAETEEEFCDHSVNDAKECEVQALWEVQDGAS